MTKKHFIQLAAALRYAREELDAGSEGPYSILDNLRQDIETICHQSNSNFNVHRFRAACLPKVTT